MNVQQAREIARDWVEQNLKQYPGVRAAHLVGSITGMDPGADFPSYKDLDFHLVLDDNSPALVPRGPFPDIIETSYRGVVLEGGLKPVKEYQSVEEVVANPEIAHHLTLDCILYDPDHLLADLQPGVRREYPRRHWVTERIAYEERALNGMMQLFAMAEQMGVAAMPNLLGYSFSFPTAAMSIANLRAPTTGSRMFCHLNQMLTEAGRPDLYERTVQVLGVSRFTQSQLEKYCAWGEEAFDQAVQYKRSPHPFQHKINPHQREYFLRAVYTMMEERQVVCAACWLMPFYLTTHNMMLTDGPEADKPKYAARLMEYMTDIGKETAEKRSEAIALASKIHRECFTLAHKIAAGYMD